MLSLRQDIDNLVSSSCSVNECVITCQEILDAVHTLKYCKRDGYSGMVSDRVINACDELSVHLTLLFSCLIVHGTVTDDLSFSTMIPIPKGKNNNKTSSSNYRAITLSSILVNYLIMLF